MTATAFRAVAAFEALTWGGLLVGMGFKYLVNGNELGVHVFGPIHGGAFVAYVLVTLFAAFRLRWGVWPTLLALAASVPPMGTLVADWWLHRTGRLTPPEQRSAADRTPETVA
ncbi:membrane protein [Nocardiopsis sp. NRRL B-16309]|nr:membrane protein [Nocardiopsis sp. NRRL B-16309]